MSRCHIVVPARDHQLSHLSWGPTLGDAYVLHQGDTPGMATGMSRRRRQERSHSVEHRRCRSLDRASEQGDGWQDRATRRARVCREDRREKLTFRTRTTRPTGWRLPTGAFETSPSGIGEKVTGTQRLLALKHNDFCFSEQWTILTYCYNEWLTTRTLRNVNMLFSWTVITLYVFRAWPRAAMS